MKSTLVSCAVLLLCVGINAKAFIDQRKVVNLRMKPIHRFPVGINVAPIFGQRKVLYGSVKPIHRFPVGKLLFCVFQIDGKEIIAIPSRFRNRKPKYCRPTFCLLKEHQASLMNQTLGNFKPECNKDGSFKSVQYHASTGYYFCVLSQSGEKIPGTEVQFQKPNSCPVTACLKQRDDAIMRSIQGFVGSFMPQCNKDGSFKSVQYHASTGYYFCVLPQSGETIPGTGVRFQKPKSCPVTACLKQRDDAIVRSSEGIVGYFIPQCNKDGSFTNVQCNGSTGFCYCVNTQSGTEIPGTEVRGIPDCPGE